MGTTDESLLPDDEDRLPEWKPSNSNAVARLDARRSLELIMERKALRKRLKDTFDEGPTDLDDLGW